MLPLNWVIHDLNSSFISLIIKLNFKKFSLKKVLFMIMILSTCLILHRMPDPNVADVHIAITSYKRVTWHLWFVQPWTLSGYQSNHPTDTITSIEVDSFQITYFVFLVFYGYTLLIRPEKQGLVSNRCNVTYYDIILFLWILGQIPSEWHQVWYFFAFCFVRNPILICLATSN